MNIVIQRNGPLGVKEQLKRQIRILIQSKELDPGKPLPSAKDLAMLLNINRNTVAQAYKELAREGMLKTKVGSGTRVGEAVMSRDMSGLEEILSEALAKARDLGFSDEITADFMIASILKKTSPPPGGRILVVDCNYGVIDDLCRCLKEELGTRVQGVLIQELEAAPVDTDYFDDIDLVVCGFNHVDEFRRAVPDCPVEMVGVFLSPDFRLMNELMRLPAGTTVGHVCVNQRSTETLFKNLTFSGGGGIRKIWAGMDREELWELLADCQVVFATHYVYDRVLEAASEHQRVVKVELTIDPANIKLVKEALARVNWT